MNGSCVRIWASVLLVCGAGCGSPEIETKIEQSLCVSHPDDPCCPGSPIIIDVEGNGFDLTDFAGGVHFNLNTSGDSEQISWTAPGSDDAWLVLDRNGNGKIDDGGELFGNFTPQPPSDNRQGYAALAALDRNHDGVIDSGDMIFKDLRLWQDRNHDGVSDPGELSTLQSHGIIGLDVRFAASRKVDEHGNLFRYSANVLRTPDSHVGPLSYDVFLITRSLDLQARKQGALQSNGAISLGDVDPDPTCGGGGGGDGPSCQYVSSPVSACQDGAALCVVCSSNQISCERVCEGFIGFNQRFECLVCSDGTCSPGTAIDAGQNCTSFVS